MKKVLAIAPYSFLPYTSGGQKFIAKFFEYLSKETELSVVSGKENDIQLAKGYTIYPLLKKSFRRYFDRSLVKIITSLIENNHFDTCIIEHPYFAWLAIALRKKTGIKIIIHTHNIEYQRFRSLKKWWWPILKKYERNSFRKADAILFITTEDKNFAIKKWKIAAEKCYDLPFGVEIKSHPRDKEKCRQMIGEKHVISPEEKILLFAGALAYKPNIDALHLIIEKINPLLLVKNNFRYKIIVCGKGLPAALNEVKNERSQPIIYAGFVDDISIYYKAADIFLNPVLSGGGVKTKIIEAIANGTTVISTKTGAIGIEKAVCGEKLIEVEDHQWDVFVDKIIAAENSNLPTPEAFYQRYFWVNIIAHIKHQLTN